MQNEYKYQSICSIINLTMIERIRQRYHYSVVLLKELVKTDFKLRYQGSALGYVWSLLRPLALFVILYFVFVKFLRYGANVEHIAVYLLLGIVLWNFFSEVTNNGVTSIVGRGDLIRKLNFPKYVIVLAGSLSALINLALNLLVVLLFAVINGVSPSWSLLWTPLLILELFVFALAMAFILGAAFVKLRDVNYIWEVVMQAAFYVTPIIYVITDMPVKIQQLLILSPVAQIIQDMRFSAITHQTGTIGSIYGNEWMRMIPIIAVCLIAVASIFYFRRSSKYFAENV